jgi:hypothetical protein
VKKEKKREKRRLKKSNTRDEKYQKRKVEEKR